MKKKIWFVLMNKTSVLEKINLLNQELLFYINQLKNI